MPEQAEGEQAEGATLDFDTRQLPFQEDIIEAPEDATIETIAGSSIGEYILEQQIGEGGMGMVWSAKHPTIGKQVAIKFLHLDRITHKNSFQRFVQAAKAVNQINHPNLIDIFSFGDLPDKRPYFVMEFLEGKSLAEYLTENGPLPWSEMLEVLTNPRLELIYL